MEEDRLNVGFGYEPHHHQKLVHKSCLPESKEFFVVVAAGRQSGKTTLCEVQAPMWALENAGSTVLWISPVDAQLKKNFKTIRKRLLESGLIKSEKEQSGETEIVFVNGSQILFRSAASKDNIRGLTANYMVIDEAAFLEKETFEEVLLPMMAVAGRKCLMVSTPRGKNFFYEMWLDGQKLNSGKFKSFRFTSEDNPLANKEFIGMAKSKMNSKMIQQEFYAEFIDSASCFENIHECLIDFPQPPQPGRKYYMGIDLGYVTDYSCVVVISDKGEMVYLDRFNNINNRELKERIKKTYRLYRPVKAYIESNAMGLPVYQDLRFEEGLNRLEPFATTHKSKDMLVNDLIAAFNEKEIKVLNDEEVIKEFEAFIFDFNPKTNSIVFRAASGFHDDIVMASGICWQAYQSQRTRTGHYRVMTTRVGKRN